MARPELTRRRMIASLGLVPCLPGLARAAEAVPASKPAASPASRTEQKIKELGAYLAKIYGEPLKLPERLPKEVAIISLSRIDHPDTTAKLLEVFKLRDKDPVIWHLAWEALHARHTSLTADERRGWLTGGLQAAVAGGFPGITVTPLLHALSELHPTAFEDQPHKIAFRVIQENSLDEPEEKKALAALRHLVKTWHDPSLVRVLIAQMNRPALADRVDFVLRALPSPPPDTDKRKLSGSWTGWLTSSNLKVADPASLPKYTGAADVFPKPVKIVDPDDKRWYGELEIGKLTVSDFDLVWAIDTTGSMNDENQMIAAETGHVIRICSLVSRRTRCGVIYARHETEKGHLQKCCQAAAANPRFYQVKGYPLTSDIKELAKKMANERIPKPDSQNEGNTHPGTPVLGAIQGAVLQMKWSKDQHAKRVVVMVGDSRMTPGSERAAQQFAAQAKKEGYYLHALTQGVATTDWVPVFKAAGGAIMPFQGMNRRPGNRPGDRPGGRRANAAEKPMSVFDEVAARIIRELLPEAYHDRVDPLVGILADYARAMGNAEKRIAELAG